MKKLLTIFIALLSSQSFSETNTKCFSYSKGVSVRYEVLSFKPCIGPCPRSNDPLPVITVEDINKPSEIKRTTAKASNFIPIAQSRKTHYLQKVSTLLSSDGAAISQYSDRVMFEKNTQFKAKLITSIIPGESRVVGCTTIVNHTEFELIR